ncbi:hypothetical protein C0J52_19780 [Blattella germanica]|nr:hypothetical protein C0J52_19780 [Blattella germanica]
MYLNHRKKSLKVHNYSLHQYHPPPIQSYQKNNSFQPQTQSTQYVNSAAATILKTVRKCTILRYRSRKCIRKCSIKSNFNRTNSVGKPRN